jgi:hypothetical protein
MRFVVPALTAITVTGAQVVQVALQFQTKPATPIIQTIRDGLKEVPLHSTEVLRHSEQEQRAAPSALALALSSIGLRMTGK